MDLSPQTMRRLHGGMTIFFVALWAAATIFGWVHSVAFISHLSIVALVYAAFVGWQGARAEEEAADE
jgi:hypothetical protein